MAIQKVSTPTCPKQDSPRQQPAQPGGEHTSFSDNEHFLTSYSTTACCPLAAVWASDPSRIPEVTARSRAAGPRSPQLPIQTSAGRLPGPPRPPSSGAPPSSDRGGRRPSFSISVWNPAACARAATNVRKLWCRFVRSPPHGHTLAWSPKLSATPSHIAQGTSPKASGSRSRNRTIVLKSGPATCSPKAGDGGACSHAPAPGCCSSWK